MRAAHLIRAWALALAALAIVGLAWVFARRVAWPYDLEWMEGGMLTHALRLSQGQPIYAPPSVDFIPYLYTPLYPALLALLGKVVGLGYGLGRAVSVLSFVGASVLGYVFVRREGGSRAVAVVALAIPPAAYVTTGAFYDLVRPDSLFLLLTTAALLVGWWRRDRPWAGAVAAALLVAAFFTKQTASPFIITLGAVLLVTRWRTAMVYAATLAVLGLPLLWGLNHASHGWFWTYVFKLHQQHDFYPGRAFVGSPVRLILLLGPGLILIPWALLRRRSPSLWFAVVIGAAGAGVACVGFGTQWAFTNAFMPGVFFLALAMGVSAGRLIAPGPDLPRLRTSVVYLCLGLTVLLAPGFLLPRVGPRLPREWAMDAGTPTGYDPRRYLPTAADRTRGDALIAQLRAAPGEVLIPFHPFYAHLAGKQTYLHRMGVLDVGRAGLGVPAGLAEAFATHRFALVVMDYKIDGNWNYWPGLLTQYQRLAPIDGPPVYSGSDTAPRYVLVPNPPSMIQK